MTDLLTIEQIKTLRQAVSEYHNLGNKGLVRAGYFNDGAYEVMSDLIETTKDPLPMKVAGFCLGNDYAYYHLAGKILEWLDKPRLLDIEKAMAEMRRIHDMERRDRRNAEEIDR